MKEKKDKGQGDDARILTTFVDLLILKYTKWTNNEYYSIRLHLIRLPII